MEVVWTIINTSISVLSVVIFGMITLYTIVSFQKQNEQFSSFFKEIRSKYYTKKHLILGITCVAFFFGIFMQELRIVYLVFLLYIIVYIKKQHKEWIPLKVSTWVIFFIQILWSALFYTFLTILIGFDNLYQVLLVFILIAPLFTILGIYTVILPRLLIQKKSAR